MFFCALKNICLLCFVIFYVPTVELTRTDIDNCIRFVQCIHSMCMSLRIRYGGQDTERFQNLFCT